MLSFFQNWTQILWSPLSKCCALSLSAHDVVCLPQSKDSTGEEPGGLTPPPPSPSPPFIVIDTAEVYCYVCSHLK